MEPRWKRRGFFGYWWDSRPAVRAELVCWAERIVLLGVHDRNVEPLRFAIRLHAFLAKQYVTDTATAKRTTAAIQIQNTGVELSIVNSRKCLMRNARRRVNWRLAPSRGAKSLGHNMRSLDAR